MSPALRRAALAVVLPLLVTAACGESAEPDPETARMDLVADDVTVSVAANGDVTGGPLVVERVMGTNPQGQPTVISDSVPMTAFFRRADGSIEQLPAEEYQLVVTPGSSHVRFIRASAFSGYLEGTATGTSSIVVCLQRRADESCVLIPQATVPVEVRQVEGAE